MTSGPSTHHKQRAARAPFDEAIATPCRDARPSVEDALRRRVAPRPGRPARRRCGARRRRSGAGRRAGSSDAPLDARGPVAPGSGNRGRRPGRARAHGPFGIVAPRGAFRGRRGCDALRLGPRPPLQAGGPPRRATSPARSWESGGWQVAFERDGVDRGRGRARAGRGPSARAGRAVDRARGDPVARRARLGGAGVDPLRRPVRGSAGHRADAGRAGRRRRRPGGARARDRCGREDEPRAGRGRRVRPSPTEPCPRSRSSWRISVPRLGVGRARRVAASACPSGGTVRPRRARSRAIPAAHAVLVVEAPESLSRGSRASFRLRLGDGARRRRRARPARFPPAWPGGARFGPPSRCRDLARLSAPARRRGRRVPGGPASRPACTRRGDLGDWRMDSLRFGNLEWDTSLGFLLRVRSTAAIGSTAAQAILGVEHLLLRDRDPATGLFFQHGPRAPERRPRARPPLG